MNGAWPNNVGPGVVPTTPVSMNGDFKVATWQAATAVGGRWNWDNSLSSSPGLAGISISNSVGFLITADDTQMTEIDAKIDDGDLTTGNFQKIGSRYTLIMATNP